MSPCPMRCSCYRNTGAGPATAIRWGPRPASPRWRSSPGIPRSGLPQRHDRHQPLRPRSARVLAFAPRQRCQHFGIGAQRLDDRRESRHLLHALGAEREAAIDDQRLARYPVRSVAGEIERGFRDVARTAAASIGCEFVAASAMASRRVSASWLGIPCPPRKYWWRSARADAIDPDAVGRELGRVTFVIWMIAPLATE